MMPDVLRIWGPDGGCGHPDHIACGTRTLRAISLVARPELWPSDRLGARINVRPHFERTIATIDAHRTQTADLAGWERSGQLDADFVRDGNFIRALPDPSRPLETDLFATPRPSLAR